MDDFPAFIATIIGATITALLTLAVQKRSKLTRAAALLNAPAERSERTIAGWALAEAAEAQAWKLIAKNEIRARPNTIAACFLYAVIAAQITDYFIGLGTTPRPTYSNTSFVDGALGTLTLAGTLWLTSWLGAGLLGGGRLYPPVTINRWRSVRAVRANWIENRQEELTTQLPDLYPTPAPDQPTPTTGAPHQP